MNRRTLERFITSDNTPWKLNNLQLSQKANFKAAIARGDIALCNRDVCLCGSHDKSKLASIDRFGLDFSSYICKNCGLIFTTPYICERSLALYYHKYYHSLHFGTDKPIESLVSKGQGFKIFNFIKTYLNAPHIKIFEMGAGCGTNLLEFAETAEKHHIKVDSYGTEYNEDYVKHGNAKGLKLTTDPIQDYIKSVNGGFDIIILSHVFEHLTDPLDVLDIIKKMSHGKTILYIELPGVLDLKIKYVYECDFLKYLTHAHTFNFSLSSLNAILDKSGFQMLKGNEKIESAFRAKKGAASLFPVSSNNNYDAIISYLTDLEANLAFYQDKNPANLWHNRLKRHLIHYLKRLTGDK